MGDATEATIELELSPSAPRAAREWAEPLLHGWQVGTRAAAVLLVISELVSNAVLHAAGPLGVRLRWRDGVVRVSVADGAAGAPAMLGDGAPADASGRGLRVVEALSAGWGYEATSFGKVVWADVAGS